MGFDSRKGRGKRIFEEIPRFEFGHRIPKTIHQIFFSDKPIPPLLRQNIDRIKGFHDGWKHALYDHGDIVEFIRSAYGPEVLRYYEKINEKYGAARADLFRYLLMYKCGGVYLDIKASVESSLDDYLLPDDEYLLCRWRNKSGEEFERWGVHSRLRKAGGSEFQQWHIIAAPGHPFLRAVIEKVLHNIDNYNPVLHQTGRAGVLGVTGPIAYTLAIAPLLKEHKHRLVDDHRSLGLEIQLTSPVVVYE
jgi:mannosyltransferase OCH1-like enzyme